MKRFFGALTLAITLGFFGTCPAQAGYKIFMQVSGIAGESTDENHKGWIDLASFSHGLSNASAGSLSGGKVSHADFVVGKRLDKSSLPINLKLNQGSHIPSVVVEFQTAVGVNKLVFYRVTMTDAVFTSKREAGTEGDASISETCSLTYKKIVWEYWPIDGSGKLGPVVRSEWDISKNSGG